MKKNKLTIAIIAALVIITTVTAAIHLSTRQTPPKGVLRIEAQDKTVDLPLSELNLSPVHGTVMNAKGDPKEIDGQGLLLSGVLDKAGSTGYTQVSAVADDEYSATVTAEEIGESGRVYLLLEEGEQLQLLVFGDTNSKRNVSHVIRLVVK